MTEDAGSQPEPITLERRFDAAIDEVWQLWTTKDGIEAWWGPDGFSVEVRLIDPRPGGLLHYAMTATAEPQVAFMQRAGMPLTTEVRLTYVDVIAPQRLAFVQLADFIPGVEPYDVMTVVELSETDAGTLMRVTLDQMHDETWTDRALRGWESQLERLAAVVAAA